MTRTQFPLCTIPTVRKGNQVLERLGSLPKVIRRQGQDLSRSPDSPALHMTVDSSAELGPSYQRAVRAHVWGPDPGPPRYRTADEQLPGRRLPLGCTTPQASSRKYVRGLRGRDGFRIAVGANNFFLFSCWYNG